MKLSSKTVTAVKLFVDLAEHQNEGYISLVDVAKRKDVSKKFLEQIVPLYKSKGLIVGSRGNQGGYALAKAPNKITLEDIASVSETNYGKNEVGYVPLDNVLNDVDKALSGYLRQITLEKLVEDAKESYINNYVI